MERTVECRVVTVHDGLCRCVTDGFKKNGSLTSKKMVKTGKFRDDGQSQTGDVLPPVTWGTSPEVCRPSASRSSVRQDVDSKGTPQRRGTGRPGEMETLDRDPQVPGVTPSPQGAGTGRDTKVWGARLGDVGGERHPGPHVEGPELRGFGQVEVQALGPPEEIDPGGEDGHSRRRGGSGVEGVL